MTGVVDSKQPTQTPTGTSETQTPAIGTPVGNVLETDIVAHINGRLIPSFNIDNETAIVAEDLQTYGFDVTWSAEPRTLVVNLNPSKTPLPSSLQPKKSERIGRKIGAVLYTDVRTFIGNTPVRSFNLDGKTAIVIDDLGVFGPVTWNSKQRIISVSTQGRSDQSDPAKVRWSEVPVDARLPGKFLVASDGLVFWTIAADASRRRTTSLDALYFSPDGKAWEKTASPATHSNLLEVLCAAAPPGQSVVYGLGSR